MWNILRFVTTKKWQNEIFFSCFFLFFFFGEIIETNRSIEWRMFRISGCEWCELFYVGFVSINFDMKVTFTTNLIVNGQLYELLLHPQYTIHNSTHFACCMPHSVYSIHCHYAWICINCMDQLIIWVFNSFAKYTAHKSFEYYFNNDRFNFVHWKSEKERKLKNEERFLNTKNLTLTKATQSATSFVIFIYLL